MTEAVRLTQELVRIESTNPGAYEGKAAAFITDYLSGCGAKITLEKVCEGRCNVIAELGESLFAGEEGKSALIFICHMDTVVLGEGWSREPLEGEMRNSRIYGRGACDMKSGLACALSVFRRAAVQVKNGERALARPLKLICTVDEEGDMKGAEHAVAAGYVTGEDWVLAPEPTDGQIQMAHKGRFWLEVSVKGITAHASRPELGADAIAAAGELICRIRREFQKMPVHDELGKSTVTFGQITGGYQPYVVPDQCRMWLDMRLAPPITDRTVLELVSRAIEDTEKAVAGVKISYRITGNRPYIEKNESSLLMKSLKAACRTVTGEEASVTPFPGYTDTAVIAGLLHNSECITYGPGSLSMAHKPDEYVETADIERCEKIYGELLEEAILQQVSS